MTIKLFESTNPHLEKAADECNIKVILHQIGVTAKHIGKLEQKREDNTISMKERSQLHREEETLANATNKIRLNCVCNKK